MFSALYKSAPKVSDLRVLLVGLLDPDRPGVISAANALTGGQFSKDRAGEKQEASVVAGGGRRLNVTYLPHSLFKTLGEAITSGRATHLDISVYHCVIIVVSFDGSDSKFWFNRVVVQTLTQSFGENFLKKHCLILVTGADQFAKARNEGRVTKSFIEWCRERKALTEGSRAVFHGVQERWLLFDTNGPPHVLKTQLEELIDMIDGHVLGRHFHTHIKFKEAEEMTQKLDSQVSELKNCVQKDARTIEQLQKSLTKITETAQELEKQFTHVTEHVQRDQAEIEKKLQITLTKSTDRAQDLENQFTHVKEQVQRDQAEIEKKLQITLTKSTDRAQDLENQFTHVKEHVQRLCSEISQIKETIHDVSLQAMEIPQNLEKQLADFKQHILKENIEIKEELKTNLKKNRKHITGDGYATKTTNTRKYRNKTTSSKRSSQYNRNITRGEAPTPAVRRTLRSTERRCTDNQRW